MTIEQALEAAHGHLRAGQLPAADALYRQILVVQPDHPTALHRLGVIAFSEGRFADAVSLMQKAIVQAPAVAEIHSDLGLTHRHLGQLDEALARLTRAAELRPELAWIQVNLGNVLAQLRRFEEARVCLERALSVQPNHAETWSNLGSTLLELNLLDESINACQRALALNPHLPEARATLGAVFLRHGMLEQAENSYRQVVALQPDSPEAHETLGFLLLLLGQYEEGWKEHERRWQNPAWSNFWHQLPAARWDGTPLSEGTLWLHSEQGLGDTIHFLRYLPLVREKARCARVVLACQPSLVRLLARADLGDITVIPNHSWDTTTVSSSDRHLPLLSLPATLRCFAPLPMTRPYLHADPELCAIWRTRLATAPGLKVGLVWAGSAAHRRDAQRSLAFEQLTPLRNVSGVTFVSAQIGPKRIGEDLAGANIIDAAPYIIDLADTAALFAALDLILTVDTATAHLAGALGRPVWTLLPSIPDWRWGLNDERTEWYPTMRLFRQKQIGVWDEVVAKVADELRDVATRSA